MWRGKSGGDEKSNSARGGSGQSRDQSKAQRGQSKAQRGQSKARGRARQAQQSARGRAMNEDAQRSGSGKKIRRIESGSPGSRPPRGGAGPVGPRSARAGRGPADPTEIGRPPSGPPAQGRSGGPSLPPLRQPTGELPVVQSARGTGDTVVVAGPSEGVFAARPTDAVGEKAPQSASPESPVADDPFTIADLPPAPHETGQIDAVDAVDVTGDPFAPIDAEPGVAKRPNLRDVSRDVVNEDSTQHVNQGIDRDVNQGQDADGIESPYQADGDPAAMPSAAAAGLGATAAAVGGGLGFAALGSDDSPTNPFPGADSTGPDLRQPASLDKAEYDPFADNGAAFDPGTTADPTTAVDRAYDAAYPADYGAAGAANPSARRPAPNAAKAAAARAAKSPGQAPSAATGARRAPASGRPANRPAAGAAAGDRLQDTEFKLAGQRRRQKPKEPNRLVLALAMALVVLVGVGVAYVLTRDGGEADEVAGDDAAQGELAPEGAVTESTVEQLPQAEPEPQVDEPTLFFDDAQLGPLQQGNAYSIDLVGEPEGSLLQVVVDDIPQGEPDALLPDLILPAGRHTLHVNMINGDAVAASTPVSVYVLGEAPVQGYRANLSSVNFQTEGWQEAIRQFDEYRAAGHEQLLLHPISDGYWNIFVQGFGEDRSAAQTYCEQFNLEVPVDCFPDYFDGVAAPADADASADADADASAESGDASAESGDSMTEDESAETGGAEDGTVTTTTAGG